MSNDLISEIKSKGTATIATLVITFSFTILGWVGGFLSLPSDVEAIKNTNQELSALVETLDKRLLIVETKLDAKQKYSSPKNENPVDLRANPNLFSDTGGNGQTRTIIINGEEQDPESIPEGLFGTGD